MTFAMKDIIPNKMHSQIQVFNFPNKPHVHNFFFTLNFIYISECHEDIPAADTTEGSDVVGTGTETVDSELVNPGE